MVLSCHVQHVIDTVVSHLLVESVFQCICIPHPFVIIGQLNAKLWAVYICLIADHHLPCNDRPTAPVYALNRSPLILLSCHFRLSSDAAPVDMWDPHNLAVSEETIVNEYRYTMSSSSLTFPIKWHLKEGEERTPPGLRL